MAPFFEGLGIPALGLGTAWDENGAALVKLASIRVSCLGTFTANNGVNCLNWVRSCSLGDFRAGAAGAQPGGVSVPASVEIQRRRGQGFRNMLASADQGILGRLDESANFRYLMALGVLLFRWPRPVRGNEVILITS